MAKDKKSTSDVDTQIKNGKKKMTLILLVVVLVCCGAGGFVGYSFFQKNAAEKIAEKQKLESSPLKDYPVKDSEAGVIYSRDISKQTYMLANGAIQFDGTMVFYNKLCANLYTGISNFKELETAEPDLTVEDSIIGDKIVKDAVNNYLQSASKSDLLSASSLSEGLTKAINKQFKETLGHEVIKNIFITTHIVQ